MSGRLCCECGVEISKGFVCGECFDWLVELPEEARGQSFVVVDLWLVAVIIFWLIVAFVLFGGLFVN